VGAKLARRVLDDGRQEFNLVRTQHNWRRLQLLVEHTSPAMLALQHLQSWRQPLHSLAAAAAVLLLGGCRRRLCVAGQCWSRCCCCCCCCCGGSSCDRWRQLLLGGVLVCFGPSVERWQRALAVRAAEPAPAGGRRCSSAATALLSLRKPVHGGRQHRLHRRRAPPPSPRPHLPALQQQQRQH
jgi:hypothetical protein